MGCRLATWAVGLANLQDQTCYVIAAGGVPGGLQTALRGEILGAIAALTCALRFRKPCTIWTDNQLVHDRIKTWMVQLGDPCSVMSKDHDLWGKLRSLVGKCLSLDLLTAVVKIRSHEDEAAYSDVVEQWVIECNPVVDDAASDAFNTLPTITQQAWKEHVQDFVVRARCTEQWQQYLVQVGRHAVEKKREVRQRNEQAMDDLVQQPRGYDLAQQTFTVIPSVDDLPAPNTIHAVAPLLIKWLHDLTQVAGARPRWLAGGQALVLFQLMTSSLGVRFNPKNNLWEELKAEVFDQSFDFCKAFNWLFAALRCLARYVGKPFKCEQRLPDGSIYRCWTSCVLIAVPDPLFREMEAAFRSRGVTVISAVKKAFVGFACCCSAQTA